MNKNKLVENSLLLTGNDGTNFIYKIHSTNENKLDLNEFANKILIKTKQKNKNSKIGFTINELEILGFVLEFQKIQSENLQLNLELIDSQLPNILSHIVYNKYKTGISKTTSLLELIKRQNPLNFNYANGHPFYELKIKKFLTEIVLGLKPEMVWTGGYNVSGGVIIEKESGEFVCSHIYYKNEFQNYLLNNTKLEQASTSEDESNHGKSKFGKSKPYKFGWVYEEDGELFIKLNLQIRFN